MKTIVKTGIAAAFLLIAGTSFGQQQIKPQPMKTNEVKTVNPEGRKEDKEKKVEKDKKGNGKHAGKQVTPASNQMSAPKAMRPERREAAPKRVEPAN